MFKSLGLLSTAQCPDRTCRRPYCLFRHGGPSRSGTETGRAAVASSIKDSPARKRGVEGVGMTESGMKRVKKEENTGLGPTSTSQTIAKPSDSPHNPVKPSVNSGTGAVKGDRRSETPSKPILEQSKAASSASPAVQKVNLTADALRGFTEQLQPLSTAKPLITLAGGVPRVPMTNKMPPQPYADRQKGMQTLFTQYTKLYAKLQASHPELAAEHTVAQEGEISASSPNVKAYKTAVHHAAVSISRRPVPDSLDHPSIGTVKESRAKVEKAEKEAAGRLTRASVEKYLLPLEEFEAWRYPDPRDPTLLSGGGESPDGEGERHACGRCKLEFVVSSKDLKERFGECRYHYGRIVPERIDGRRKWIYTCCRRERDEPPCEDGVHVFHQKEDDAALARRAGFKTVKQVVEELGVEKRGLAAFAEVVGVDCEMIYTTAGSSLARATLIDANGKILLDELVRQDVPVLDCNTRYSGVTPQDLSRAVMDLSAVRAACCMYIGPDTIMVGHGLENDLRALRLLHDRVIDTAVVFPHDKGRPYRRALRDIVKEKLGLFIQDRTADFGHSSAEDAQATLDVLRWKVRDDAE